MVDPARFRRAALLLAALGATLGTALDGIHTHLGATAYTHPVFWRAAWWVPPLFGGAFAIGMACPLAERFLRRASRAPASGAIALAFVAFIGAYFLSVAPLPWPATAALLLGIFVVAWARLDRSPVSLGIAVLAAFGGPAVEALLVTQGLFHYHRFTAFGVPGWLPFLYMVAAVPLTLLARRLVDG
jgi:hypothetical protein